MSRSAGKPIEAIKTLLEQFPFPAWIFDDVQTIIYMNHTMQEMFGDLSGKNISIIYDSGSFEIVRQPEIALEGIAEVVIADVPFHRLHCEVDFEEDGGYSVEVFKDISEQKRDLSRIQQTLAKMSAETRMAQLIQKGILPINDIYWNTIAYSSLYKPADDLGGDFYDVLRLNDNEFLFYAADVSGHGIQASLLTVFMRERVRIHAEAALTGTAELLARLVQDFVLLGIDGTTYVTMVLCKYVKSGRTLAISNAGHGCLPLIVRNSGQTETIQVRGMPICLIADGVAYEEEIVSMNPGDRLVLFTDGIIEEVDSATGQSFGAEGVRKLAEAYHSYSGEYLTRKVMDESARYALISAKDDRTIIVADILS